jgi:hypothetical protein
MRTATLTFLFMSLLSGSAWGITVGHGGGGNKINYQYARLDVVNQADGAVAVSVNGGPPVSLEPLAEQRYAFLLFSGNKLDVTVSASLVAAPSISVTKTVTLQVNKLVTATITSPTSSSLAITVSAPDKIGSHFSRESGVMLASTGGLLPLLWLSFVLGRSPRRRRPSLRDGALAAVNRPRPSPTTFDAWCPDGARGP